MSQSRVWERGGRSGPRVALVCALALCASLLAACSGSGGESGTVKVGAILPMSGAQADLGATWQKGIRLAVDVVNEDGGIKINGEERKLEVKFIDTESTPNGAQRAVHDLLADGTKFWLGPALSANFATAYGTIKGTDTQLVLTPSAASEAFLAPGNNLLFKVGIAQTGTGVQKFADFLVDEYSPKTAAVFQPQTPTGDILGDGLVKALEAKGVKVVYKNKYDATVTDYTPFISAIRAKKPDIVVGPYIDAYMAAMMDQAVQVGYTQPVFANYGGGLAALGDNRDKISQFAWQPVTRAVDNPNDKTIASYVKKYVAKFGHKPTSIDYYSLSFYDPVIILAEAIEKVGAVDDPTAVGKQMRSIKDWPEMVLPYRFDDTGLSHYTYQVGSLKNGKVTYQDLGEG